MKLKFVALVLLAGGAWVHASHPWLGKTLTPIQVQQRWGRDSFDEAKFKSGDQLQRAKMAYSLMISKKLLGLAPAEIRERLGRFDGHYFSESYPTYLIQTGAETGGESWQIVFLIDEKRKTKDVIVHKNCCD